MPLIIWLILLCCSNNSLVYASELVKLRPYTREVSFIGFTRPVKEMTVAAEIDGKYTSVLVDVGDKVGSEGVVAKIDPTFVKIDITKNQIEQRKTERQLALEKKTLARFEKLINQGSTTQATYDDALLRAEVLELSLKSLKNEENRLRERLERHTLYGPVGWQVTQRLVEPGEFVRQGEPLLKLGDFNSLVVPFLFTYEELRLLRDMPALQLYFSDLGKSVDAIVYRVAPDFDDTKRKIATELIIESATVQATENLRGGLRTRLTIAGKIEKNSYRIPHSAIINRYEAHWLLTPEGEQRKVILLGSSEDGNDAIINGGNLSQEDVFVTKPDLQKIE